VLLVAFASLGSQFASGGFAPAAAECLAAPGAASPPGRHWFYRVDRADRRKCWYLGPVGRKANAADEVATPQRSQPRLRPPLSAAARPPASPATELTDFAREEDPVVQPAYAPLPAVAAEIVGQPPLLDSTPPDDDQAQDEMPSVWPELTPSEKNLQPSGGTPSAFAIAWIIVACMAGFLMVARFLTIALVEWAGSRRFDALANRINALAFSLRFGREARAR
jgi:hypothetical protein